MKIAILGSAIVIALAVARLPVLSGQVTPADSEIPVLTVCEALNSLGKHNNAALVLVGKVVSTMEGSWLGENCDQKLTTDGYEWPNFFSLTYGRSDVKPPPRLPAGFTWDSPVLQSKLAQVQKTTKLEVLTQYKYSDKWFAIFGRLETRLPLHVVRGGDGKLHGSGFGHMGAAPARLIADRNSWSELKSR